MPRLPSIRTSLLSVLGVPLCKDIAAAADCGDAKTFQSAQNEAVKDALHTIQRRRSRTSMKVDRPCLARIRFGEAQDRVQPTKFALMVSTQRSDQVRRKYLTSQKWAKSKYGRLSDYLVGLGSSAALLNRNQGVLGPGMRGSKRHCDPELPRPYRRYIHTLLLTM